jgi:uncharacterized membrane protein
VGEGKRRFLSDVYESARVHPISVHVPNGALPAALLFFYLGLATGDPALERCSVLLLGLVVIVLPISLASGVYEWKRRFARRKVGIFYWKITLATLTLAAGLSGGFLRALTPEGGTGQWVSAALFTAMLPLVVLLGHFGGKLVFEWRKPPKATADTGDKP